jgi:hypothetical protein
MANTDLDVVIRQLAKQQAKHLMAAVKARKAHYGALAGKAKTADAKAKYKHLAQEAAAHGTATARRLQMSADNAADSYARLMRQAAEFVPVKKVMAKKAAGKKPAGKSKGK